jgi:hypothetical protein
MVLLSGIIFSTFEIGTFLPGRNAASARIDPGFPGLVGVSERPQNETLTEAMQACAQYRPGLYFPR